MGQESQHEFRRKNNKMKYALVCVTLFVAAAIAVGLLMWGNNPASTTEVQAAEPFLGSAELCGTCQLIPEVDTYKLCHTCFAPFDETTRLTCDAEEALIVTSVKSDHNKHRAQDVSLIYHECRDNRRDDGVCQFNLQALREEFVDYVQPRDATEKHPGEYKVYYICVSDDLFFPVDPEIEYTDTIADQEYTPEEETDPEQEEYTPDDTPAPETAAETEYSLSKVRWNDFELENYPILSSALMKCDNSKPITENWDKGKVCVTDLGETANLQCDSTRTDVRILVAKIKSSSTVPLDKKFSKTLARRTTNLCAENMLSGSCAVTFSDIFEEGETLEGDGQDIGLHVVYLCSYAPEEAIV